MSSACSASFDAVGNQLAPGRPPADQRVLRRAGIGQPQQQASSGCRRGRIHLFVRRLAEPFHRAGNPAALSVGVDGQGDAGSVLQDLSSAVDNSGSDSG